MSSDAKIAANRNNAQKSTGPRTARGKSKSSLNAVTHGIYALAQVLPGEDEDAYLEMAKSHLEEFSPVGRLEMMLVFQMVGEAWRLQRIDRAARDLHERLRDSQLAKFYQSLSTDELVHIWSTYRDEGDNQEKQQRPQVVVDVRDDMPEQRQGDSYPAEFHQKLASDLKTSVEARFSRLLEPDSTILAGMVGSAENAPQTGLNHERRATERAYFANAAKLKEYQQERLTVTVTPVSVVQNDAAPRTNTRRRKPLPTNEPANQNHQRPGNEGTEKRANGARTKAAEPK